MKNTLFITCLLLITLFCYGQQPNEFIPNYDETKVPDFAISDPLILFNGERITNKRQWEKRRRPELLEFFSTYVYGIVPDNLEISKWEVVEQSDNALNGRARRKQVNIISTKMTKRYPSIS